MRFPVRWPALLVIGIACLTLIGWSGCSPGPKPPKPPTAKKQDDIGQARDLYHTAAEAPQFRDANDRTNNILAGNSEALARHEIGAKDKSTLQALLRKYPNVDAEKLDGRALYQKFLEAVAGLDRVEIEEVESPSFTLADAHYLAGCYLFREIARSISFQNLSPLEQVEFCWSWVTRHVVLQQSHDTVLPPQYVLMRGQGSALERAAVFLAVLQQMTPAPAAATPHLEGCLIGVPGQDGQLQPWLAGVLIAAKDQQEVYLFDPRLGIALPGPNGKGIATLAQLRANSIGVLDGFKVAGAPVSYDVDPERAAQAKVMLACPLSSLSSRMRYLEDELLFGFERINLACRAPDLTLKFEKPNGGPVRFWNPAKGESGAYAQTPTRALRLFLPPDEGGIDKTNRLPMLKSQMIPWPAFLQGFAEQKLTSSDLDSGDAQLKLQVLGQQIWVIYCFSPEQELLRGRLDDCTRRLVRIQKVVNETKDRNIPAAEIAAWRDRVTRAYSSGNPAKVFEIWSEDQWLESLVNNPDEDPASFKGAPRFDEEPGKSRAGKSILSAIVLRAVSEPVQMQCDYLLAMRWQEKAERTQADSGKQPSPEAWNNADSWWSRYAQDNPLTLASFQSRLESIKQNIQGSRQYAAAEPLALFGKTLRQGAAARLLHARALRQLGKTDSAAQVLKVLAGDLAALEKEAQTQRQQWGSMINASPAPLRLSMDGAFADMGPDGSLFWLRFTANLALAELQR